MARRQVPGWMSRAGLGLAVAMALALLAGAGRGRLARARRRLRTSSSPSTRLYEALAELLLGGLYDRIASDVASLASGRGRLRVLEVGPGPGHLAVRLARAMPTAELVALDIDPEMARSASARVGREGLAARIRLVVGDVAGIPFEDAAFDLVVTSFSAHHWTDPDAGLREIRRVVRPGGRAIVYDLPDGWGRFETGAPPLAETARRAGWDEPLETAVAWPWTLRLLRRVELARR